MGKMGDNLMQKKQIPENINDVIIFILTLKSDSLRRNKLIKKLEALGLSYEIIYAIDGRKGLPKIYEDKINREKTKKIINREMTDGEYACALSHQIIYNEIIDRNIKWAIILEDDAIIDKKLKDYIEQKAYMASDIVHLYHSNARVYPFIKKKLTNEIYGKLIATTPFGTVGYSISLNAAKYIVKESIPISHPADWPCDISKLNPLACDPIIVNHPPIRKSTDLSKTRPKSKKKIGRIFFYNYWRAWLKKRVGVKIS
jgi:glycosyl transferase, family 25